MPQGFTVGLMDLLIELIIWLFRALLGEPENTADISLAPKRPLQGSPTRRGPYNYGDGRQDAARPKTLEEILEAVRREAGERQSQGVAPQQRQAQSPLPKKQIAAQPAQKAPEKGLGSDIVSRQLQGSLQTESGVPTVQPIQARQSSEKNEIAPQVQPKPAQSKPPKPIDRIANEASPGRLQSQLLRADVETIAPMAEMAELGAGVEGRRLAKAAAKQASSGAGTLNILQAIRSAPLESKLAAARQAIVISEVFGMPRSRRPHLPGRRMF